MEKSIIVEDLLISYSITGDSLPTLVFLHGWGSNKNVWDRVIENFSQDFRCLAIDLPGFGKSQMPSKTLSVHDYSRIINKLLDKLDLGELVLIGHSFGGAISIVLSSINEVRIRKLILVDSSGIRLKREKFAVVALGARILSPLFKPKFMQGLRRKVYKFIGNEDYLDSGELRSTYLKVIEEDISDNLCRIDLPTLIVWGESDKDTPLWMAEKMKKDIDGSKLHIFPKSGHYSFLENLDEFVNILRNFLGE